MGSIIEIVIMCVFAAVCLTISCFQFREKGFIFNNAYIFANKEERETMDKRPYYRQSAIVFLLIGIGFLIDIVQSLLKAQWINLLWIFIAIITVFYAVISTIIIQTKK